MICQQYISKVKGWSESPPPRPSASPGAPRLKAGEEASQAPSPSAIPRYLGGHMEPWFRANLPGFQSEFFHFLVILDLGKCFILPAAQFPHLLMGYLLWLL